MSTSPESPSVLTPHEEQSLALLEIQTRHHQVLADSGLATAAYTDAWARGYPLQNPDTLVRLCVSRTTERHGESDIVIGAVCFMATTVDGQTGHVVRRRHTVPVFTTMCGVTFPARGYTEEHATLVQQLLGELDRAQQDGLLPNLRPNRASLAYRGA